MGGKKHVHGDGSVYQRASDGKWCEAFTYEASGVSKRKTVYGATRQEARQKRKAFEEQIRRGVTNNERHTVESWLHYWLEHHVKPHNARSTYLRYKRDVDHHLVPRIGAIKLSVLAPIHVQPLINELATAGPAVRNVRNTLRRALNIALRYDLVYRNVACLVDMPQREPYQATPLTISQCLAFLRAVQGHRLEALYWLELATGLRRGEICGLRVVDCDFETGRVSINGSLTRLEGKLERTTTKTRRIRSIQLPAPLVEMLEAHLQRYPSKSYVFTTANGTPYEPRNVVRHFKRSLVKAGLPSRRFHDLRHTVGTLLAASNQHPKVAQVVLGHANVQTTLDIYTHINDDQQATAIDLLHQTLHSGLVMP